jgi:hypothetical protein
LAGRVEGTGPTPYGDDAHNFLGTGNAQADGFLKRENWIWCQLKVELAGGELKITWIISWTCCAQAGFVSASLCIQSHWSTCNLYFSGWWVFWISTEFALAKSRVDFVLNMECIPSDIALNCQSNMLS